MPAGLNKFSQFIGFVSALWALLNLPCFKARSDLCVRACLELFNLSCIRLINSLKVTKYL